MTLRARLPFRSPVAAALALLGLTSLGALATSCGADADSVVLVHVAGPETLPALFRLRATLSNADLSDSKLFPAAAPATQAIPLPTAFSITLPRARAGNLDIALDGLGAPGNILANGAASVALNPGGRAEVTITLAAGASLCGDGHVDPGEDCDDGDRVSNGTCDFRCQRRAAGDAGADSGGGVDAGHEAGNDSRLDAGTGGSIGGTGGRGTGGTIGGTGGAGVGGTGGAGVGGVTGTGGIIVSGGTGGAGGCALDLLTNGTFDAGNTGWTTASTVNAKLIYAAGDPALGGFAPSSPSYLALLGRNLQNAEETLSQAIHVPATANTLTMLGFIRVAGNVASTCPPTCNAGAIELIASGNVIPVKNWTTIDSNTDWVAFSTTLDAMPLRDTTVTFRMRATATSATVVPFYFDSLAFKADRCP